MVHQYGMGATRTTIQLHHARVLLLDASLHTVFDQAFSVQEVERYLGRLLDEIGIQRRVFLALFQAEKGSDRLQHRRVLVWQPDSGSYQTFTDATAAAGRLLRDLGFTRYEPLLPADLTEKRLFARFSRKLASISTALGLRRSGVAISSTLGSEHRYTVESQTGQSVRINGWEPSVVLLDLFQERLQLLSPQELTGTYAPESISMGILHNRHDETYKRLRTGEILLLRAVESLLDKHMECTADHNRYLAWLLHGGYTLEALDVLHRHYPVSVPPQPTDWLFHIVLYAALYRGAYQGFEDALLRLLVHKAKADGTPPAKAVVDREYSAETPENNQNLRTDARFRHYLGHFPVPVHVHVYRDDRQRLQWRMMPNITASGKNPMAPEVARQECQPLLPVHATALRLSLNARDLVGGERVQTFRQQLDNDLATMGLTVIPEKRKCE